jgi:hypothetical protein
VTPGGWLEVFAAVHLAQATRAGWSAARMGEMLMREAEKAIQGARVFSTAQTEAEEAALACWV